MVKQKDKVVEHEDGDPKPKAAEVGKTGPAEVDESAKEGPVVRDGKVVPGEDKDAVHPVDPFKDASLPRVKKEEVPGYNPGDKPKA
jgi:hypothetical protein